MTSAPRLGRFITFEGGEGVGKSTLLNRIIGRRAAIVDRFLGGLDGMAHKLDRDVLLDAVGLVAEELGGDPLRWSAPVTQLIRAGRTTGAR